MTTKPIIPEVLPLVREYLSIAGNLAGGNLHIVLDDGNVDDASVRFCIARAEASQDVEGVELGKKLLAMSKTQRRKIHLSKYHP